MPDFLNSDLVKVIGFVIVLGVVLKLIVGVLKKPKAGPMQLKVRCDSCGWTGIVGKYNQSCPSCNGSVSRVG